MGPHDPTPLTESTSSLDVAGSDSTTTTTKYEQNGEEARHIAQYLPYFPFKGIPRFYDIGGFLYEPAVFRRIVDIFVHRYKEMGVDLIAG